MIVFIFIKTHHLKNRILIFGFDEIDKKNFLGKWKIKNKNLYLSFQKRDDSSKIVIIEPFEEVIKLRKLKNDFKKLK